MADVTELLMRAGDGDLGARDQVAPLVYGELKKLAESHMRRERRAHSVAATQLVNDAFMKLVGQAAIDWSGRGHFYAIASRSMRQILVDHARARGAQKRGDGATHVSFDEAVTISAERDEDILAIDAALTALEAVNPRHAEIVTMRFYGGLSMKAVAEALEVSKRTADREWVLIRAWLRRELAK